MNDILLLFQEKLFEDWKQAKFKHNKSLGAKLYTVKDEKFINRLINENLCKYILSHDGSAEVDLRALKYEDMPDDFNENTLREDTVCLEICMNHFASGNRNIEEIAKEVYIAVDTDTIPFECMTQEDKNYYFHKISICFDILEKQQNST